MTLAAGALGVVVMWSSACATGTSAAAASTYGRTSVYRSATAYVELAPDQAFNSAVSLLLDPGDIEITDLKEAHNRCQAVAGDRRLTFRVIESANGRSRLSMLVGGGDDPNANQELADTLMRNICGGLDGACDFEGGTP